MGTTPGQSEEISSAVNEGAVTITEGGKSNVAAARCDFFGRIVHDAQPPSISNSGEKPDKFGKGNNDENKVWVSFHEGFSNAVRKPITLEELMRGF